MLKRLSQCLGLASLILVVNYGDLLGGGADVRMHTPYRLTSICLAQIADILLLGTALFAVLIAVRRTRVYRPARFVLLCVMPPYLLWRTETLFPFTMRATLVGGLAVVWIGTVLLLSRYPPRYRQLLQMADAAGVIFAVFGICSIGQLLWVIRWHPGIQQITPPWHATSTPRKHAKIVWVIFDELSYDQLFEHRATGLDLPNVDALRRVSTVFTQMQPIGLKTVKVVPSLLSGAVIDDLRYGFDNRITVHHQGQHGWHALDGAGTVFGDAQMAGWRTAAVGWYNPYCALYGSALDSCYWTNLDRQDGDMAQQAPMWRNIWAPLASLGTALHSPRLADQKSCELDVRQRYRTHQDLEQHSTAAIVADQADLVFLHLAVPHSPNIWDRARGGYTQQCGRSYLDGLALVDHELGLLLQELERSPRWQDTTLIIQGDHSWRTQLFRGLPAWTHEDEQASRGVFDPRPALLIHEAGQTEPHTDTRPMPLLYVHDAIENVLRRNR